MDSQLRRFSQQWLCLKVGGDRTQGPIISPCSDPKPHQPAPPTEVAEIKKDSMREGCSMRKCKAAQKGIISTVTIYLRPETAFNGHEYTTTYASEKRCGWSTEEVPMLYYMTSKYNTLIVYANSTSHYTRESQVLLKQKLSLLVLVWTRLMKVGGIYR